MSKRLRIWCNMSFPPAAVELLERGTAHHELVYAANRQASNLVAGQSDPQLLEADVAFGQPDPQVILRANELKLVHLSSAGYERYDRNDIRETFAQRGAALTSSSSVYAEPCAEHALGMMLSLARQLPWCTRNQLNDRGWPATEVRAQSRLLMGQTVVMLGFGAIGRRLAELLAPFGTNLFAIRRSPRGEPQVPTYPESYLERLLPSADHVVNILPGGEKTAAFMSRARFELMKPEAVYYSIGRGSTTDQEAMLRALQDGRIAAAYLDVTSPEPLPADHPLWSARNCHITPHTAGGHDDEHIRLVQHFLANLGRYETGKELIDKVIG